MSVPLNKPCPCGHRKTFAKCCYPLISGAKHAETAEQLMRSRYSAFCIADVDYIQRTMRGPAAHEFNAEETAAWAKSVRWVGLTVLACSQGMQEDDGGTVEFVARYRAKGVPEHIHENSAFEKHDGLWFYTDQVL